MKRWPAKHLYLHRSQYHRKRWRRVCSCLLALYINQHQQAIHTPPSSNICTSGGVLAGRRTVPSRSLTCWSWTTGQYAYTWVETAHITVPRGIISDEMIHMVAVCQLTERFLMSERSIRYTQKLASSVWLTSVDDLVPNHLFTCFCSLFLIYPVWLIPIFLGNEPELHWRVSDFSD